MSIQGLKVERNNAVLDAYHEHLHKNGWISPRDFAKKLKNERAPRFYVTYENARRFTSMILRGLKPKCLQVYYDLADRLKKADAYKKATRYRFLALEKILEQEAPSFYLSEERIISIIYTTMRARLHVNK